MAICVMDDVLEHSPAGGAKYAPQVRLGSLVLHWAMVGVWTAGRGLAPWRQVRAPGGDVFHA